MERLLESILDGSLSSGNLLARIKAASSAGKNSSNVSKEVATQGLYKVGQMAPCQDEAILLLTSLLLPSFENLSSITHFIKVEEDLMLSDHMELESVSWIRLGLFRAAGSKISFSGNDVLDLAQKWSFFNPEVASTKQSVFKARFVESLNRMVSNVKVGQLEFEEGFASWVLGHLYGSDDLLLQKAKELTVSILLRSKDSKEKKAFFDQVLQLESSMKVKYQLLSTLLDLSKKENTGIVWNFPSTFLPEAKAKASSDRGLAPAICDCFTAMMVSNHANIETADNSNLTFDARLLDALMTIDEDYQPQLAKYLLPRVINARPHLVKGLFKTFKVRLECSASLETFVLILLSYSSEFGGLPEIDWSLLEGALLSSNDEVRLGAFGCVCRSFGPNKPATQMSLHLIKLFIRHLLLDSSANLRQKALVSLGALYGSLISRMYSLLRQGQSDELQMLVDFIESLLNSMLDCLQQDKLRFSSTDLALRVLLAFGHALEARQKSKGYREATQYDAQLEATLASILDRTLLKRSNVLLNCILDNSFDTSRLLARDIILQLKTCELNIEGLREDALKRLASPKESLADGASLLLLLLIDQKTPYEPYLDLLSSQLKATREDMANAATSNNLNGTLCLLGHLLDHQKPSTETIERLKTLAIEVGSEVSALASQPSPEGSVIISTCGVADAVGDMRTSQMVLTFCWRAIKESSNVLAKLVTCLDLSAHLGVATEIMDHIVALLLSLRHPGAFSALEDPLKMVSTCLFASNLTEAHSYPQSVLERAVQDCLLQPEIQVTRRSAGLPICLSSIIAAAMTKTRSSSVDLVSLMEIPAKTMLQLINSLDLSDPSPSPSIIHALNILRSFFRNSTLDLLTGPFLTASFEACFRSFNSASWSICNGAMMLFGALVRRTFGSASSKDPGDDLESHLDLRQLAAKFPDLILCLQAQIINATQKASHIYPILSVLQRVRFSSGAIAAHPAFFEATFAFLCGTCFGHEAAKIRMMAQRLMVKSLLVSCPEQVLPKLKEHLFALRQKNKANELITKLTLLVTLMKNDHISKEDLSPFNHILCTFWTNKDLPAALRRPALVLRQSCSEEKPNLPLDDLRVEPYLYELLSELDLPSLDSLTWTGLKSRLIAGNPTIQLTSDFAAFNYSRDAPEDDTRIGRLEHYGLKKAALTSTGVSPATIEETLKKHPRNPDIIRLCLASLSRHGELCRLIIHGLAYLDPSNGYSDVIRQAVIDAVPNNKNILSSFNGFMLLRFGLTDDDEDIRIDTAEKVHAILGLANLSLPATLEALHRDANRKWPVEYKSWMESLAKIENEVPSSSEFVLFDAEPLNLFVDPSWEKHIAH